MTATTTDLIPVTIDTLDLDRDGAIHITLASGEEYRSGRRAHDEDPRLTATRRLVSEGFEVVGRWTKTSAVTHTATVRPHPQACTTCISGCDCTTKSTGCGHHGCYGQAPTTCGYADTIRLA